MVTRSHIRHHWRFYSALAVGVGIWLGLQGFPHDMRLIIAGNGFFGLYLVLMTIVTLRMTLPGLRHRATIADEGAGFIIMITLAAIAVGLGSMFSLLQQENPDPLHLIVALAGVPLGWITLHTISAYHYAHVYYRDGKAKKNQVKAPPLQFPGKEDPGAWDFLYLSFVIGMTAQVSDVQVTDSTMRRKVLAHGVVSFFFNTVLIALAVNVAATVGR